jgi:hypothetical protein
MLLPTVLQQEGPLRDRRCRAPRGLNLDGARAHQRTRLPRLCYAGFPLGGDRGVREVVIGIADVLAHDGGDGGRQIGQLFDLPAHLLAFLVGQVVPQREPHDVVEHSASLMNVRTLNDPAVERGPALCPGWRRGRCLGDQDGIPPAR